MLQAPRSREDTEAAPKTAATDEPLPTGVTQSPPLRLDGEVRKFIAGILEMRIPAVKIHTNQAADQVARQLGADAVTFGERILFRAGRYEPETPRGLGLLGHELTHAARAGFRPVDPSTAAESRTQEETLALRNEQRILNQLAGYPAAAPVAGIGAPSASDPLPKIAAGHPAASDRAVSGAAGPSPPEPMMQTMQLSVTQLRQIKDDVYRDLMERLRTEFERGG